MIREASVLQRDVEKAPDGLRSAADAQCSPSKQIVLLSSDMRQLDLAANLVANLASVGAPYYLILGSERKTCEAIVGRLACVWSSLMEPFRPKLRDAGTSGVRTQWLVRQIYVGRLAAMGFSPMLLDADVVVFANPFKLIDENLPHWQAYFLGDSSAGWLAVNGGTLYLRKAAPDGPVVRMWREFERRVFKLINTSTPFPKQMGHKTRHGWVGEGMAADALLYDQNVLDWAMVGELTGDREYIGRGFVPTQRWLTKDERKLIEWQHSDWGGQSTPSEMARPEPTNRVYSQQFVVREIALRGPPNCTAPAPGSASASAPAPAAAAGNTCPAHAEGMVKAPAWLFSSESDLYVTPGNLHIQGVRHGLNPNPKYGGNRVTAGFWGMVPPVTALVHFVCTRWPGSEGRKIGMRLLRKWYTAEIARVIGAPPAPASAASVTATASATAIASAAALPSSLPPSAISRHPQTSMANATWANVLACLKRNRGKSLTDNHQSPCAVDPPLTSGALGRMIGFRSTLPVGDRYRARAARCPEARKKNSPECNKRWRPSGNFEYDREMVGHWHRLLGVLALVTNRKAVLPLFECKGLLSHERRYAWVVHVPMGTNASSVDAFKEHAKRWQPACTFRIGEGCFGKVRFPDDLASLLPEETLALNFTSAEFASEGVGGLLRQLMAAGAHTAGSPQGVVLDLDELSRHVSEDELRTGLHRFLRSTKVDDWMALSKRMRDASASDSAAAAAALSAPSRRLAEEEPRHPTPVQAERRAFGRGALATLARSHGGRGGMGGGGGKGGGGRGRGVGGFPPPLQGKARDWESKLSLALCPAMLVIRGQPYVC